jgi:hypothetical protein
MKLLPHTGIHPGPAVAVSGSAHTASPHQGLTSDAASAVSSPTFLIAEEDSDGFKAVSYRKKTMAGAPAVISVKHHRQSLKCSGVWSSTYLPTVSKKEKFRTLFVSRFSLKSLLTMQSSL